jgi:hypothetical protein
MIDADLKKQVDSMDRKLDDICKKQTEICHRLQRIEDTLGVITRKQGFGRQ